MSDADRALIDELAWYVRFVRFEHRTGGHGDSLIERAWVALDRACDRKAGLRAQLAAEEAAHAEEIARLTREADALALALREQLARARDRADQYEADWRSAKIDFGDAMAKARTETREAREQLARVAPLVEAARAGIVAAGAAVVACEEMFLTTNGWAERMNGASMRLTAADAALAASVRALDAATATSAPVKPAGEGGVK